MALALYRTYRPATLAQVVGQEHVTEPLARALEAGRIHHAYLLSGPRGCGKTSTARILARSLNCEKGPTASPCGQCRSCQELAPNGPGSLDVVEMDAATHRGVDDARDLRERAVYAPAVARYKIYIIDEAHQLTTEAANALLKLIEEPPPHLRFIFATTEPDKILPTIRSRTFHYGFRLVPIAVLAQLLTGICEAEKVPAEPAALSLVARAGAGSARDSLSILGQLLAGVDESGLTYDQAVRALGVTDQVLIDEFVDALAGNDAAAMFGTVSRMVSAGHDPRRFLTDVLDRLRDLILVQADPSAFSSGLVDLPDAVALTVTKQAERLGQAQLSRAADLVSAGLSEIRGATAPRLQLELLCARVALPSLSDDLPAVLARLEALEREAKRSTERAGVPVASPPRPAPPVAVEPGSAGASEGSPHAATSVESRPPTGRVASAAGSARPADREGPVPPTRPRARASSSGARPTAERATPSPPDSAVARASEVPRAAATQPAAPTSGGTNRSLQDIRASWPDILDRLRQNSRVAWMAFTEAHPLTVSQGTLAVAVADAGRISFLTNSGHGQRLRQAILDALGIDVQVEVVLDPAAASSAKPSRSTPAAVASQPTEDEPSWDDPDATNAGETGLELLAKHLGGRTISQSEDT